MCISVVLPEPLRPKSRPSELDASSSEAPFTMGSGAAADTNKRVSKVQVSRCALQAGRPTSARGASLTWWLVAHRLHHEACTGRLLSRCLGRRKLLQQGLEGQAEVATGAAACLALPALSRWQSTGGPAAAAGRNTPSCLRTRAAACLVLPAVLC